VGAVIAVRRPPGPRARSHVQHVAAGLVFAAAAVEVLPDVMHRDRPLAAALGFAAGVALALAIRLVAERAGEGRGAFVGVLATDLFVDGLLIGVTATAPGEQASLGALVAAAVAVELLSLGLSLASVLEGAAPRRVLGTAAGLAVAPLTGAVAGALVGGVLTGGWTEAVLAFAVAVFLFMAAEELLTEAHEVEETPLGTALFFAAFLTMMTADMVFG
jgi:ZIP family zinc transporter